MSTTATLRDPRGIDPNRLYPLSQARLYIASPRTGEPVSGMTMSRWRKSGIFKATYRPIKGKRFWFIAGRDVLSLIGVHPSGRPGPKAAARTSTVLQLADEGLLG